MHAWHSDLFGLPEGFRASVKDVYFAPTSQTRKHQAPKLKLERSKTLDGPHFGGDGLAASRDG